MSSHHSSKNKIRETLSHIYHDKENLKVDPEVSRYVTLLEKDPKSRVFAPLADRLRELGQVDEAIELCQKGLRHHPEFQGGILVFARCLSEKGKPQEAENLLLSVYQSDSQNLAVLKLLSQVSEELKKYTEAIRYYQLLIELNPEETIYVKRVEGLKKKLVASVSDTEEPTLVIEDHPESQDLDHSLESKGFVKAIDELGQLVFLKEEESMFHFDGFLKNDATHRELESYEVKHVSEIFNNKINREITTETLAELYFKQGQYDKSLAVYEKMVNSSQELSADVRNKIEVCRSKLGVKEGRQKYLTKQESVLRQVLKRVKKTGEISQ